MANAENRVSTLNGWFKEQYADAPVEAIPAQFRLQENIGFGEVLAQGNKYHIPIVLQYPSGFTYAGPNAGAFGLNQASAGATQDATVQGFQVFLREAIDYESAKLAATSKAAFGQVTQRVVKSMTYAMRKRLEIEFLYGQMGLGTVSAVATNTLTITTSEWAAGIWVGSKGAQLEIRTAAGALRGFCSVASVSLANKTITVDAAPAGTVATDVIWFKGAFGNECAGVHKILTNSGSLFGIDASVFELWAGASFAAGAAALSFQKLQGALNAMLEKGCENDVVCLLSHKAWSNLMTTEAARRQYDYSYTKEQMQNGATKLKFFEQTGSVTMAPSTYVKEGSAYLLSKEDWLRVGATDVTFALPDSEGKEFIRPMSDNAGFELRSWSHQAPFCKLPGRSGIITGIVNS
jgi:hypothetical protein